MVFGIFVLFFKKWIDTYSKKFSTLDLEARPVFVSIEDYIKAHFLTCFVALVIPKILEMNLNSKYSITKILETLSKAECSHIKQNCYLFDYYNEVLKTMGTVL